MKRNHFLAAAALALLFIAPGCTEITPPEFNNPGDPLSPDYKVSAPAAMKASFRNFNSVLLQWRGTFTYETGFVVERSVNNGPFEKISTLPVNSQEYLDSGLDVNKSYAYRVYTLTENSASGYSQVVSLEPGSSIFLNLVSEDNATAGAFSHNMNYFATAHYSGTSEIRLRNNPYSIYAALTSGSRAIIKTLSFSPNDELLACGAEDNSVSIWNVSSRTISQTITGINGAINSLEFSPNGNFLAVASQDKNILIYDVKTWSVVRTLSQHTNSVNSVSFNHDGTLLASGSSDGSLILWNTSNWTVSGKINAGNPVKSVAFSPDGKTVAAASGTSYIQWEVSSGKQVISLAAQGGADALSVAFSSDGKVFAGSCGAYISFYDTNFQPYSVSYGGNSTKLYAYNSIIAAPQNGLFASIGYPVALWEPGAWQIEYK